MKTKTIKDVINDFLWHCQYERRLDMKTLSAYRIDLNQFLQSLTRENKIINSLSKDDVKKYLLSLSNYKQKTISRKLASLKAMLYYYECEEDSFINPIRKMQIKVKNPIRLPIVMTLDEIKKIFEVLYKKRIESNSMNLLRDIAIVELLFASGMRVSELCSLRNRDVDINNGIIRIIGKGNKERIVQICHKETLASLISWYNTKSNLNSDTPFFTNRLKSGLSTQSVRRIIHNVVNESGISKHITPHTFRHTFATLLLEEDVDIKYIQHLLGHSSIVTTQIYTHVNLFKQKQILLNKHPRRLI